MSDQEALFGVEVTGVDRDHASVRYLEVGKFQRPGDAAETQIASAVAVYPKSGTWRGKVLSAICEAGDHGMTDEEIQLRLGMNPSTQRPRRVELVEGGWIEDSGRRRMTRSRREAVVWVAT